MLGCRSLAPGTDVPVYKEHMSRVPEGIWAFQTGLCHSDYVCLQMSTDGDRQLQLKGIRQGCRMSVVQACRHSCCPGPARHLMHSQMQRQQQQRPAEGIT